MPRAAFWLAVALLALSCARPYPPPGGERDQTAPRLLGTTPEPLAVVAASADPVVFRFDDRLSERNFSEALVIVSPLDSAMRVERSGNEVRVSIDGGWRADRVYRVVLLPGLRDLFANERRESVELVFSTGAPVPNTAVAGIVLDRITGQPAVNPVIDAVRRDDSARYMAVADSGGFFALRHLPLGEYELRAYADANRNRRRDPLEPVDSGAVVTVAAGDTLTRLFHVLAPDTTAPNVNGASALDSLHVRLVLDDYVTADAAAAASAQVLVLPDSAAFAAAREVLIEPVYQAALRAAPAASPARSDTLAADTAAADTAAVQVDPAAAAARADSLIAAAAERPARELVVRLDRPLEPETEYIIVLRGLENLHGLTGDGSAPFRTGAPAPAIPPAAADTTAVRVPRSR